MAVEGTNRGRAVAVVGVEDPEWGENMDQAEMDWAEALARESIEKQDDPLLTRTRTLTLT